MLCGARPAVSARNWRRNPSPHSFHVARRGDFSDVRMYLRSAVRSPLTTGARDRFLGLRVGRTYPLNPYLCGFPAMPRSTRGTGIA